MDFRSKRSGGCDDSYFESIFKPNNPDDQYQEAVMAVVASKVSADMNDTLLHTFSEDEVSIALSQMYPPKAPV